MKTHTIVGFTYVGDNLCPACALDRWSQGTLEHFNGPITTQVAYKVFERIAAECGVDYEDENAYDSNDFPKPIFSDQVEWNQIECVLESDDGQNWTVVDSERCGVCQVPLLTLGYDPAEDR